MEQREAVGWTTTVLISSLNVPQAVTTWRRRSVEGLSLWSLLLHLATGGLYLWYGTLLGEMPIVVANVIYVVVSLSLLVAYARFSRPVQDAG